MLAVSSSVQSKPRKCVLTGGCDARAWKKKPNTNNQELFQPCRLAGELALNIADFFTRNKHSHVCSGSETATETSFASSPAMSWCRNPQTQQQSGQGSWPIPPRPPPLAAHPISVPITDLRTWHHLLRSLPLAMPVCPLVRNPCFHTRLQRDRWTVHWQSANQWREELTRKYNDRELRRLFSQSPDGKTEEGNGEHGKHD